MKNTKFELGERVLAPEHFPIGEYEVGEVHLNSAGEYTYKLVDISDNGNIRYMVVERALCRDVKYYRNLNLNTLLDEN